MRGRRDMEGREIKEKKEDNTTEGGGKEMEEEVVEGDGRGE